MVFGGGETEIDRLSRNGIVTGNNCWYSTRVKCAAHCAAFWQTYRWQFEHRLMLLMRLTRRMINANSLLLLATQSLLLSVLLVLFLLLLLQLLLMMIYDSCTRLAADAACSFHGILLLKRERKRGEDETYIRCQH